jgi:hypothetical protein
MDFLGKKIPWSAVPWNGFPWKKFSLLCRITKFPDLNPWPQNSMPLENQTLMFS